MKNEMKQTTLDEFKNEKEKAVVILSGGQDSVTCLAWAINKYGKENVETLSFDYGQRHKIELDVAKTVSEIAGVKNTILPINTFKEIGNSALLEEGDISANHNTDRNLPASFVPGRNLIFLTFTAAFAFKKNIKNIITGVCQTDFSGYFDCRNNTIKATNLSINLGMGYDFNIETPLMWLTKAETVELMNRLGKIEWLKHSHTCYEGKRPACGICPSCKLRIKGFQEAGVTDPIEYEKR